MNRSNPLLRAVFAAFALLALPGLHAIGAADPAAPVAADWPKDAVWYQIFTERFRNGDRSNDPTRDSLDRPIEPSTKWRVTPWTGDWYERADWEKEEGPRFYKDGVLDRRYGGDLQGVLDKLDYLAGLGINAIYFNPLFYSRSLHKYDGCSFHHIDPFFGPDPRGDLALIEKEDANKVSDWTWTAADKLFLHVVAEAHKRGMHVILDGVFNHSGRDFFAFKDLKKNQERSPYRSWYVVHTFDDPRTRRDEFDYEAWWGYKSLPIFARAPDGNDIAPGPKAYIFAATKRWMLPHGEGSANDGIDGWRLDVADERPAKFWADWNTYVRSLNPIAYTSCETWRDASKLIADGRFSGCMNYHAFAIPVKGFLIDGGITAAQFLHLLNARREALPKGAADVVQNLIDSHDTDRAASMIVNAHTGAYSDPENIEYNTRASPAVSDTYKIQKPDSRHRAIQRLVALFQVTYEGAPMLYYGDEAGMWGGNDPDNRMPMVWADLAFARQSLDPRGLPRKPDDVAFDESLFQYYRSAIELRRSHASLSRGAFHSAGAFDEARAIAFRRETDSEDLLVVLNRSEEPQTVRIVLDKSEAAKYAKASVLFTSTGGHDGFRIDATPIGIHVSLPPLSGAVVSPRPR